MGNIIVVAILIIAVFFACFYMWKEKKKGNKCLGCPMSGACSHKNCDK